MTTITPGGGVPGGGVDPALAIQKQAREEFARRENRKHNVTEETRWAKWPKHPIQPSPEMRKEMYAHQLGLYAQADDNVTKRMLTKTMSKYKGLIRPPNEITPSEYDVFSLPSLIMAMPVTVVRPGLKAEIVWTGLDTAGQNNNLEFDVNMTFHNKQWSESVTTNRVKNWRQQQPCPDNRICLEDLYDNRERYAYTALRHAVNKAIHTDKSTNEQSRFMEDVDMINFDTIIKKELIIDVAPNLVALITCKEVQWSAKKLVFTVDLQNENGANLNTNQPDVIVDMKTEWLPFLGYNNATPETDSLKALVLHKLDYARTALQMVLRTSPDATGSADKSKLNSFIKSLSPIYFTEHSSQEILDNKVALTVNTFFKEYTFNEYTPTHKREKKTTKTMARWSTWPTTLELLNSTLNSEDPQLGTFVSSKDADEKLIILKPPKQKWSKLSDLEKKRNQYEMINTEKKPVRPNTVTTYTTVVNIRGFKFTLEENTLFVHTTHEVSPIFREPSYKYLVAVNGKRGTAEELINVLQGITPAKIIYLTFSEDPWLPQEPAISFNRTKDSRDTTHSIESVKATLGKTHKTFYPTTDKSFYELTAWAYGECQGKSKLSDTLKQMGTLSFTIRLNKHPNPIIQNDNNPTNTGRGRDPPLPTMTKIKFLKTNTDLKADNRSYFFNYDGNKNTWLSNNPPMQKTQKGYGWYDATAKKQFWFPHPSNESDPASTEIITNAGLSRLAEHIETYYHIFSDRQQTLQDDTTILHALDSFHDLNSTEHHQMVKRELRRGNFHFLKIVKGGENLDFKTLQDRSFQYRENTISADDISKLFECEFVARKRGASGEEAIKRMKDLFETVPSSIDKIFAIPFDALDTTQDSKINCDPKMKYKEICENLKRDLQTLVSNFEVRRDANGDPKAWHEYSNELQSVFSVLFCRMHSANKILIGKGGQDNWNSARWSVFVPLSILYKTLGGKVVKSRKSDLFEAREYLKSLFKISPTKLLGMTAAEGATFVTMVTNSESAQTEALTKAKNEKHGKWQMSFTEFNSSLKTNLVNFFASADHALELCGLMLARRSPLFVGTSPVSQSVVDVAMGTLELTMMCYATCCKISLLHLQMAANHKAGPLGYAHPGMWDTAISGRDTQKPLEEMDKVIADIMKRKTIEFNSKTGATEIKESKINDSWFSQSAKRSMFRDRRIQVVADCQADVETAMRELNNILAIESNYNMMIPEYVKDPPPINPFKTFDRTEKYYDTKTQRLHDLKGTTHGPAACSISATANLNKTLPLTLGQSIFNIKKDNTDLTEGFVKLQAGNTHITDDLGKSINDIKKINTDLTEGFVKLQADNTHITKGFVKLQAGNTHITDDLGKSMNDIKKINTDITKGFVKLQAGNTHITDDLGKSMDDIKKINTELADGFDKLQADNTHITKGFVKLQAGNTHITDGLGKSMDDIKKINTELADGFDKLQADNTNITDGLGKSMDDIKKINTELADGFDKLQKNKFMLHLKNPQKINRTHRSSRVSTKKQRAQPNNS